MKGAGDWLVPLWRMDWLRCKKDWKRAVSIDVLSIVIVCVIYVLRRESLEQFVRYTLNMPAAIYAFWGIAPDGGTGKAAFYVQWVMMFLHVWIVWRMCTCSIFSVWHMEERGAIFYFCNQWYSRQQIILATYLGNVVKFIIEYGILFVTCLVLTGAGWGVPRLLGFFLKGCMVIVLFMSVCTCYAVFSRRKEQCIWTGALVIGTLTVGNVCKFRDLIILLLQKAGRNYVGFYRLTGWLDGLRWLSPLSWLNPYIGYSVRETVIQTVICVTGIALSIGFSLLGYRVRRIE